MAQIIPVIMCGGAGTRLWPVSRESMPKQFVPLVGKASTFQAVLERITDSELFARPIVITKDEFRFVVAEQLRERGIEADIVLEPTRRNSGPAVAVAAVLAAERDRNALVLVLAADHVIRKPKEFRDACRSAASAAAEGRIVTFGIEPTGPATSYGYIRPGNNLNGASVRAVEAFVEKPDADMAATYTADGYLWNSGNFLFHAITMLSEIERLEPVMAEAAKAAVAGLTRDLDFIRLAAGPFARAPMKSIDYAVMERTKLAAVVPADLGWSDVGSWASVWDVTDHDAAGNATDGPVVVMDSRNSLVRSDE
jgi:mannose-1-phosphate guanylyltransferase/mannose-6-phosphate isomerase